MSHLGERLTALVDGELGHDERDRALAHLAICAECRAEAETLRRLKGRLRSLGDSVPPPDDLIGKLYGMSGRPAAGEFTPPDPAMVSRMPAMSSFLPADPARTARRRPADNRPRGRGAVDRHGRRVRGRTLLVGAATLAVLGVGGVSFAAGGDSGPLPRVNPPVEQFSIQHALTSGDVPVGETTTTPSPSPSPSDPASVGFGARPGGAARP